MDPFKHNCLFTTIVYSSASSVHIITETLEHGLDDHVKKFWNLGTIGIKTTQDKGMTTSSSEIESDFPNSFCKIEDYCVVKLPWKPEGILSSNNDGTALKRFQMLCQTLHSFSLKRYLYRTDAKLYQ
ncbi:hypothetical protein TNIN_140281 [Trichonephila inaurata madagascariensis]|uniref:Uncharacterized protein n=1 Tax=Trichonephila inaurata madagascariensis TaxID=2747483 RepID=A0A8X7C1S7_9ARAC|nr:hypothetical protein TNIN_140281 [Trichonephila inaurata madagascariensis]